MKAEFTKDENGTVRIFSIVILQIWFVYASEFGVRSCKGKAHIQQSDNQISEINKQNKEALLQQLEAHQ